MRLVRLVWGILYVMSKTVFAQVVAVVLVLVGAAFVLGWYTAKGNLPVVASVVDLVHTEGDPLSYRAGQEAVDFVPYWRVWNTLENKFIPFSTSTQEAVPATERLYGSIEGLVASYDDPYTVFMRPQAAEDFKVATKGELEGIGALIGEHEGGIVVVAPLPGSPAEKAGLVSGDRILKIGDLSTEGLVVDTAVGNIRGPGGTEVTLEIQNEAGETRSVPITRGRIEIPSTNHEVVTRSVPIAAATPSTAVPGEPVETQEKDFYVLRLFNFSQSSVAQFERELRTFAENGTDSLIIDLRGNPGGYLDAAVAMAGWFLPEGSPVVRESSGPDHIERVYVTRSQPLFAEPPKLAILVNKGSASAAEILAGALQEEGRAVLIGENTFGKGSVQELVDITPELALKVTVARWYTPGGVSISKSGLTPDIVIAPEAINEATSSDPWIEAAIEHLSRAGV